MQSNKLLRCIKCGHEVSISARSCPGCGSAGFRGVTCSICMEYLDEQAALQINRSHYHQSCIEQFFSPSAAIRCEDCGSALAGLSALQIARHETVCSHCGSHLPLGGRTCLDCHLPMVLNMHLTIEEDGRTRGIFREVNNHAFCKQYRQSQSDKELGTPASGGCLSTIVLLVLIALVLIFRF